MDDLMSNEEGKKELYKLKLKDSEEEDTDKEDNN